jgi:DNA-binding response OmpR family regulator
VARILICEDDALTALDLEEMLREAGHDVVAVIARVSEGYAHVVGVDVALLDMELADGSSVELARALARSGVGIVFVSGNRDEDLPDDIPGPFQEKPFTPSALLAAIARLVTEREAGRPDGTPS